MWHSFLTNVENKHTMYLQRSRDSGGDDDAWVKQQLSSLIYVKKVVEGRITRIQEGTDNDSSGNKQC